MKTADRWTIGLSAAAVLLGAVTVAVTVAIHVSATRENTRSLSATATFDVQNLLFEQALSLLDPDLSPEETASGWAALGIAFALAEDLRGTVIQEDDWGLITNRLCAIVDSQNRVDNFQALEPFCE